MCQNNEATAAPLSTDDKLRRAVDRIERIDFLIMAAGEMHATHCGARDPHSRQIAAAFSMLEDEIVNLRHFLYGEALLPPTL